MCEKSKDNFILEYKNDEPIYTYEDDEENEIDYTVGKKLVFDIRDLDTGAWKEALRKDRKQIETIMNLAHKNNKVTYKQVKNELNLDDEIRFKGLNYNKKTKDKVTGEEKLVNPEESAFIELKKYHEFKKAIGKENFVKIGNVE